MTRHTEAAPAPPAATAAAPITAAQLLVHTLVTARYHPDAAALLAEPARAVLEQARARGTCSVAELAAGSSLPLNVARDVIARLHAGRQLVVHPDTEAARSPALLGLVLDALHHL